MIFYFFKFSNLFIKILILPLNSSALIIIVDTLIIMQEIVKNTKSGILYVTDLHGIGLSHYFHVSTL